MRTIDASSNAQQTQDVGTWVTATAAAGSIVTLTIPAPPAGQRVFINHLTITRFASALLTAAATPTTVTTTNLSGSPSWDFAADAALQGAMDRLVIQAGLPMSSQTVTTAVTIVGPATTAVIWRITANYAYGNN
jgi:hypothetical protein